MNEAMKAAFESKNQIRGIHKNLDGSYIDAIQQAKWEGYQAALSQQPARPSCEPVVWMFEHLGESTTQISKPEWCERFFEPENIRPLFFAAPGLAAMRAENAQLKESLVELRKWLMICRNSIAWHMKAGKATNMDDYSTIPAVDKLLGQK